MVIAVKKLDPLKSVVQQVNGNSKGKLQPVLIHQHPGRITPLVSGLTTDQKPIPGNYSRTTIRL